MSDVDGTPDPHDNRDTNSDTTEVNLDEFLDEDDDLLAELNKSVSTTNSREKNTDIQNHQNQPANEFEEEEYLHLEIDFDEDPYELPNDIDMKIPLGRDEASPDAENTSEDDSDFDLIVEEWDGNEDSN